MTDPPKKDETTPSPSAITAATTAAGTNTHTTPSAPHQRLRSLGEVDLETLRAQSDADPTRFSEWDPNSTFRAEYVALHPERYPQEVDSGNGPELNPALERTETARDEEKKAAGAGAAGGTADSSTDEDDDDDDEEEEEESRRMENVTTAGDTQYEGIRSRASRPGLSRNHTSAHEFHRTETKSINGELERHTTALDRISTHRTQHFGTVGGSVKSRKEDEPLPGFGAGKPYPPELPNREEYVVEFDGAEDPIHAQNWPFGKKLFIGAIVMFDSVAATFGSSVFSAAASGYDKTFHIGSEVGTLGTSLFVLGYAFGPILWAPFSELYGRRIPIIIGAFGFGVFAVAVATAKDVQTIIICRFFNGLFGSCPLAVVAAIFADIFSNETRGLAVSCFAASVFMGPLLAPFVGGFLTSSGPDGWRWTEYLSAIMGFISFILTLFFLPETYAPIILVNKASELRRRTQNWGIHAKQEEIEVDFGELLTKNVMRPLKILFTEPIVLLITIYMSFIYGLLYLFLTAYALAFQGVYHMKPGIAGLTYFGLIAGELVAFGCAVAMNPSYVRRLRDNHNVPVPEWRLPLVMVGSAVFAVGLFWFGWTANAKIHWIVPTVSGLATGFGIFSIFLGLLNYLVDAYLMFAASALAGNTFMRSIFGAVFPLFARYMFVGIGLNYGSTLIGVIAVLLIPLPFTFYYFGRRIRARSTFAPAPDIALDKKRDEEKRANEEGGTVNGGSGENGEGEGVRGGV